MYLNSVKKLIVMTPKRKRHNEKFAMSYLSNLGSCFAYLGGRQSQPLLLPPPLLSLAAAEQLRQLQLRDELLRG